MCSPHSYRWRGERHRANQVYALTTHQLQVERERVIVPIKCMRSPHTSYRWRGERVIEPIKCMRSPHTSYRWRERDIEPIKCMRSPHTATGGEERVLVPIKCMRPTHQLQVERRESSANQVDAPTTHQLQGRES